MDPEKKQRMINEGLHHLRFSMMLYRMQMEQGMYFLHEHPDSATSWKDKHVQALLDDPRVHRVRGDMCCFGMYQEKDGEQHLVKKPPGFMTNAPMIAEKLDQKCDGGHEHVYLLNGRAKRAEVYPDELCFRILEGLVDQMKMDGRLQSGGIGAVCPEE